MTTTTTSIINAVDAVFDREIAFLEKLIRFPSVRGEEQAAQSFMASELAACGYEVDQWEINLADIEGMPGFSPVIGNYDNAVNVVGTLRGSGQGRSLILNGHMDVVPAGPLDMWEKLPFEPYIKDGWMYGRGSGDMKAGLASNLFAIEALKEIGLKPASDIFFQSVVEEECTGNGALACLQRGYKADAVLIPEPFAEKLATSQVGVLWFQVRLQGLPTHVAYAGSGANAIEAALPIFHALHELEKSMNEPQCRHYDYEHHHHALNLNIGKIEGGDWTSSVPAWCVFDVRLGIFPGQKIDEVKAMVEQAIEQAGKKHPFLADNLPIVTYNGFEAEGYSLDEDKRPVALEAVAALGRAHKTVSGEELIKEPITATTDARFFGLYADTPALVYGPRAEAIHGFNERVELESVKRITQSTALFIADWCGLEKI